MSTVSYHLTAAGAYVEVPRAVMDNRNLGLRSLGIAVFALFRPEGVAQLAAVAGTGRLSREEDDFRLALLGRAARDGQDALKMALQELHQYGGLPWPGADPRRAIRVPAEAATDPRVSLRAVGLLAYAYAEHDATATIAKIVSGQPGPGEDEIARIALRDLHAKAGPESIGYAARELLDAGYLRSDPPVGGPGRG